MCTKKNFGGSLVSLVIDICVQRKFQWEFVLLDCKLRYAKFIRNSSWVYSSCLLVYDSVWLWCLWVSLSFWLMFMSVSLSVCLSLLNDESLFITLFKRPSVPVVLRSCLTVCVCIHQPINDGQLGENLQIRGKNFMLNHKVVFIIFKNLNVIEVVVFFVLKKKTICRLPFLFIITTINNNAERWPPYV